MHIPIYHVDAFTQQIFSGNPAAVCVLQDWLSDEVLNAIAKENNLPVTTFLVRDKDQFNIRWITPEYELDICGHGSLAAGFVIFNYLVPELQQIDLYSRTEKLVVLREDDWITLDFPIKKIEACTLPLLTQGLGAQPLEVFQHKNERCVAVFASEEEVKNLQPDMSVLKKMPHRGITVTAKSDRDDFVSRTFYPHKSISEDPATGASHCLLAPYWGEKLNKTKMKARQVSTRGGEMVCEIKGDRVFISGQAVLYKQGECLVK